SFIDAFANCAITTFARVFCWVGNTTAPKPFTALPGGILAVSTNSSRNRFCALGQQGRVSCWGNGPLGDGHYEGSSTTVAVVGLPDGIVAITSGDAHHCALSAVGEVFCWGYNWAGQIGDGSEEARYTPVSVSALS